MQNLLQSKRSALLFALLVCTALFSCKKKSETKLERGTELSTKIGEMQKNAQWAYELEGERLSKKISSIDSIEKGIALDPSALIALGGGNPFQGIFPELEGFTNLDTTNIRGEVLDTISSFCTALIKYTAPAPKQKDESGNEIETEAQKDSSSIDQFFYNRTLYSLVLFLADSADAGAFKSFIVGQPFIGDETIEVPIRFTCANKILYTLLYPISQDSTWKIQQIEIYKTEKI